MITLGSNYQFIGRTNAVPAYGSSFEYYILLYAKTKADKATGKHSVSVKMRLACTANSSFYEYRTSAAVSVGGSSAFAWDNQRIPAAYWGDSPSLTVDGVTYRRWVDLAEGAVEVDTNYTEQEVEITAFWQRKSISSTPPDWLPSTKEAKATLSVVLPAIEAGGEPEQSAPVYHGVRAYADGMLVYDSRLEDYDLDGLKVTSGINIGGTAELTMPLGHPAYHFFVNYRTIVTIYRDGVLRFRGRSIFPTDNYNVQRTITCEGEMCFLRDGVSRPCVYTGTPAQIFTALIEEYNSQVEAFKRFTVGEITVTDSNDYVRLEIENAEQILDTVNKLLERCGGYITFSNAEDGSRAINWYPELLYESNQTIEFGENLLDFASTGGTTDAPATGLVPYGAKNETTGKRLTIESVNGGKDYLLAEDAQAVRGTIMTTATWDDVTEPENLLKKADYYLASCKMIVTSLELSALDLSHLDKSLDLFTVGDLVRVISRPHGLDEYFELSTMEEDMLNPAEGRITLGKAVASLTGADVAAASKGVQAVDAAKIQIKTDYQAAVKQATEELQKTVSSEVLQSADEVLLQVAATYATKDALNTAKGEATAEIELKSNAILLEVSEKYTTKTQHETLSSRVETLAGSISLEVSGSLGNNASIVLKADGKTYSQALDLAKVREAFANDKSEVAISGGTVTFNSGTFIVNSTNLQVDKDGNLTAKNANLSGSLSTENGLYKSQLNSGKLRFYYDDTELGSFASTRYTSDTSKRGIAMQIEPGTAFMSFSQYDAENSAYTPVYIINYGMNPGGLTERHLFYGDLRLIGGNAHFNSVTYFESNAIFANTRSVRFYAADGTSIVTALTMNASDQVVLGVTTYRTYVQGSEVHLGNNSYPTSLYGSEITVQGPAYFQKLCYHNNNAVFYNTFGVRLMPKANDTSAMVLKMDASDKILLGNDSYPLSVTGSEISVSGVTTFGSVVYFNKNGSFANNYGVVVTDTSDAAIKVLYMTDTNDLRVGNSNYNTRIYGKAIVFGSGLQLSTGYITCANGYGFRVKDTAGTAQCIITLNTGDQCVVGTDSYQLRLKGSTVVLNSSGATVTSDRRKKNSIEEIPEAYLAALDNLTPKRFKFNDGTSGRYHIGFIAQEVEEALTAAGLTAADFGGFVDLNGDGSELGLIYTEFIGLLAQKIKNLEAEIKTLKGVA